MKEINDRITKIKEQIKDTKILRKCLGITEYDETMDDFEYFISAIGSLQESFDKQLEGHKHTACKYSDEIKETKRLNALVESQKEEIEKERQYTKMKQDQVWALLAELESLKAITELAVKGLQQIWRTSDSSPVKTYQRMEDIAQETLDEIERLSK